VDNIVKENVQQDSWNRKKGHNHDIVYDVERNTDKRFLWEADVAKRDTETISETVSID
jgi:hypothetical protein